MHARKFYKAAKIGIRVSYYSLVFLAVIAARHASCYTNTVNFWARWRY